jgi:predicted aconitase with swiveling domain
MKIKAHRISKGKASGRVLLTKEAISFLGSVDPKTGIVVEKEHELEGEKISEKILLFPCGKGSTVGSYVIYQLKKNNVAPAAMINLRCEPIVAVGAIISGIPLVDQPEKNPFEILRNGDSVLVDADNEYIEIL